MTSKPDIVVMMMLYNGANDLQRSLDSLAAQTYRNFHLIIVDDCSPDNSYDIAAEYKKKFDHFELFKNPKNKGAMNNLHDTLNLVEQRAPDADFFLWACSDDWFDPNYLQVTKQMLIDNPNASVCQTWFDYHDLNLGTVESHRLPSIESSKYNQAKIIFYGHVTEGKSGFYNQAIHGLMRIKIPRYIYPDSKEQIARTSCTEISALIYMLINGPILIYPKMMFHKIQSRPFTEKHPDDPLSRLYGSIPARVTASLSHLPRFIRNKAPSTRLLSVLLLWMHLFYYYGILCSALLIKDRYFRKSGA